MFLDFHYILKVGRCPNVRVHSTLLQCLLMGFFKGAQRWHEYKGGLILVHAHHALTNVLLALPHFKPLIPHPPPQHLVYLSSYSHIMVFGLVFLTLKKTSSLLFLLGIEQKLCFLKSIQLHILCVSNHFLFFFFPLKYPSEQIIPIFSLSSMQEIYYQLVKISLLKIEYNSILYFFLRRKCNPI